MKPRCALRHRVAGPWYGPLPFLKGSELWAPILKLVYVMAFSCVYEDSELGTPPRGPYDLLWTHPATLVPAYLPLFTLHRRSTCHISTAALATRLDHLQLRIVAGIHGSRAWSWGAEF